MKLSEIGPRQTHLTHPLLPVVGTPGDWRCPVCLAVHVPLAWLALGLGPSLQPLVLALQRLQDSPQAPEGLDCCP